MSGRLTEIRQGFAPAFWVANFTELFERLAYYGLQAVLAIYLHERLGLSETETSQVQGNFGFIVWFLPIIGGALADRFGFRRTLATAYAILAAGYFLFASIGGAWLAPARAALPMYWLVLVILMVPALGPGLVKPVVAGTTARASAENVRSLGYSIYYTIVNIGGMLGPLLASFVRTSLGPEAVFVMSGSFSLAMFLVTVLTFREPPQPPGAQVTSVGQTLRNLHTVVGTPIAVGVLTWLAARILDFILWRVGITIPSQPLRVLWWGCVLLVAWGAITNRFMMFLFIFSGFYAVFWQVYIGLPLYVRGHVDPNSPIDALLAIEGLGVISTTVLVAWITRRIRPLPAMAAGVAITALAWLILTLGGSPVFIGATLLVVALGEALQASRFYEYCSRLAPQGQEGQYMGFAFLPIAIGFLIAGRIGGRLVHYYGEVRQAPSHMWYIICAIGLLTSFLLILYDRIVRPVSATPA